MSNTECQVHEVYPGRDVTIAARKYADENYVRVYLYVGQNAPQDIIYLYDKTFDEVVQMLESGKYTYIPPQRACLIMEDGS